MASLGHNELTQGDMLKDIFFKDNWYILTKISPNCVPKGLIGNNLASVQVMVWSLTDNKALPEPKSMPTYVIKLHHWAKMRWEMIVH